MVTEDIFTEDRPLVVKPVIVDQVLPLRQHALRPGQNIERCRFDADFEPATLHLGVHDLDEVIAVGTLLNEGRDGTKHGKSWRIRGMAVQDDQRGRGLGGLIIRGLLDHARAQGGDHVWCNARLPAESFYLRHGMSRSGAEFNIPDVGAHVVCEIFF